MDGHLPRVLRRQTDHRLYRYQRLGGGGKKLLIPKPTGIVHLNENQQYTWRCEIVDGGEGRNSIGYYPSLQVDSEGRIHIAYYDLTTGQPQIRLFQTPPLPTPPNRDPALRAP